eukprot:scaffold94336_cov35-Phaeocystis_antarctica.AAC.1
MTVPGGICHGWHMTVSTAKKALDAIATRLLGFAPLPSRVPPARAPRCCATSVSPGRCAQTTLACRRASVRFRARVAPTAFRAAPRRVWADLLLGAFCSLGG